MKPSDIEVIYEIWIAIGIFTLTCVGAALVAGLRGKGTLVQWRIMKLVSALLGSIGIGLLMLTFESNLRAAHTDPVIWRVVTYANVRLDLLHERLAACSDEKRKPECSDLRRLDDWIEQSTIRDVRIPIPFRSWFVPELAPHLELMDRKIEARKEYSTSHHLVRPDDRALLAFCAAILLAVAVAGSVGEAAFQLRQAKDARNAERSKSGPAKA